MKTHQFKRVFLLVVLVLGGTQLFANNFYEIRGKITKTDNSSVSNAVVTLSDSKTFEVVAVKFCSKNGQFVFTNLDAGDYFLSVNKPGFNITETYIVNINEKGEVQTRSHFNIHEKMKDVNSQNIFN